MKKIKILAACLALNTSVVFAGGIPTVDPAAIMQGITNHVETIKQWEEQFNAMKKQYDAISGLNNWKDVLNSEYFWDFFPKEAQDILNGKASTEDIMNKINKSIANDADFNQFKKKELDRVAAQTETAKNNYKSAVKRSEEIKELVDQAGQNEDLKASVDYGNSLQAKIALVLNELTRMQAEAQVYDADNKERDKIEEERYKKAMDMSGGAKVYKIN